MVVKWESYTIVTPTPEKREEMAKASTDEVRFYDNENGFREVAFYQNGTVFPLTDHLPQWLHDFIAYQKQA